MSEAPGQQSPNFCVLTWTLCLLAALVLYVLSIGPVEYLHDIKVLPDSIGPWVKAFYAPLVWLDNHTPLQGLLAAYLTWWAMLAVKP